MDGGWVIQRPLREVVIIHLGITYERGFKFKQRGELGLLQKLADASIEAFHRAVGLRMAWWA